MPRDGGRERFGVGFENAGDERRGFSPVAEEIARSRAASFLV
jgi:hypothetical protein